LYLSCTNYRIYFDKNIILSYYKVDKLKLSKNSNIMTLDQLEMLEAIIQEGSYQGAAKKINKSQPALTAGIKKIEQLYNIKIFSRAGYRPELTHVGRRFYQSAKQTLSSFRELQKTAKELGSGIEPQIKISVDPLVLAQRFEPLLKIFDEEFYCSTLSIESGILFDNAHCLLKEEVDLAIGHLPQIDNQDIEHQLICHLHLVPVIHQKYISNKELKIDVLQKIPNIIVKTKNNETDDLNKKTGKQWYVDTHARKTEFIAMGLGWGRISTMQLEDYPDLVTINAKLVEPVSIDIYLMRNKQQPHGPLAQKLWKSMQLN
jgi:DNA-binding transcriptional LysR family regulator